MTWRIDQADCLKWLAELPEQSVDLVMGSPPYEDSRTYGVDFKLKGQQWVDWMMEVYRQCVRVCRGATCFVVGHGKGLYGWSAAPYLLTADLHRAGFHVRPPLFFHRNGIPGSGQRDWFRADTEHVICVTSKEGRLPWSDNTAMGHPPKWAPGGVMANRLADGTRVNQWGPVGSAKGGGGRNKDGTYKPSKLKAAAENGYPSHRVGRLVTSGRKPIYAHNQNGERDNMTQEVYEPPVLANPGNLILEACDLFHCNVGGGVMGDKAAHENEAPFPEELATFLIRSLCQPDGTVVDCFSGSGTTAAMAVKFCRNFLGCDIRASQVKLGRDRVARVTPLGLFEAT